jgi:hypothetical protein
MAQRRDGLTFDAGQPANTLGRFLAGYFRALLSRLRKTDGNCLLPAPHCSSLASFAGFQSAMLLSPHRTLHRLARGFAIFSPT